jgi:hypothetical protein
MERIDEETQKAANELITILDKDIRRKSPRTPKPTQKYLEYRNTLNKRIVGNSPQGFFNPLARLSVLTRSLFGDGMVNDWLSRSRGNKVRNIIEITNPTTQCTAIIGQPKECWICGLEFLSNETREALKPVCEHILPVAQAHYFLSLYNASIHNNDVSRGTYISEEIPYIMLLEYGWAHTYCNAIKSDTLFMAYSNENNRLLVTDDDAITTYIDRLIDTNFRLSGANVIQKHVLNHRDIQDSTGRVVGDMFYNRIIARIDPIVAFINEPVERNEGNLIDLARYAVAIQNPRNMGGFKRTKKRTFKRKRTHRTKRR